MSQRTIFLRLGVIVAVVVALFTGSATVALAASLEPTLSVTELQDAIDTAGGSLEGHLKTVVKGSTIITIPVHVLAVTQGFSDGPEDMSSLIFFKAWGPEIDEIGGIAAGMSGSPIYVNVGGSDKLIGALSYGDIDTLNGAGLATPIEAMEAMQNTYSPAPSPAPRRLSTPVVVDGQVKTKVQIVPPTAETPTESANTMLVKPLAATYLGGVNPKSRMYKAYSARLAKLGMSLIPLQAGLSSKASTYSADFEPGSAIAVLAARGDLWFGGIGTVTYVDTHSVDATQVVAFGHPAFWEGDSGLFVNNAWIDGVWPSSFVAYKLGRPAALAGTLVQDRVEGVVGIVGQLPEEATVTAHARNEDTGKEATTTVEIPRHVINSSSYDFYGIATQAAWIAGSRLFNSYTVPGSADTTTTIEVVDRATDTTFTLVRTNHFSDPDEIAMASVTDVDDMIGELQSANGNGIAEADILSVNLETTFHKARSEGEVASVNVPGGLKTGVNTAKVSLLAYGQPATQTVDVTFTIPAGTPLTGELTAFAVNDSDGGGFFSSELSQLIGSFDGESETITDRRTAADVVKQLSQSVDNTTLGISFKPVAEPEEADLSDLFLELPTAFDPIEATATTQWVLAGSVTKTAPTIDAALVKGTVKYGSRALVMGFIDVEDGAKVTICGADVPTATVTVSEGSFDYLTPVLRHTTTLHVAFAGDADTLAASSALTVKVAARTTISASRESMSLGQTVTLRSEVLPHNAAGKVAFQRWNGLTWSAIKTIALPSSGKVAWGYKPTRKGSLKLRAHYLGGSKAVASNSRAITVIVK